MSFASALMNIPVIDEAAPAASSDTVGRGYEQRDRVVDPEAGFARPFTIGVLSRQEIKERAKDREQSKSRIFDVMAQAGVKPLNQGQTPFCWCNGVTDCVQIGRVLAGSPHVPLSPASVCGPVKNYRYEGGWGIQAAKYGAEHGWCPVSMWPANEANKKYDTEASRAERRKYQIAADGWIDLPEGDWDALFTCLVMGFPCSMAHMEWQHLVTAIDVGIASNGELMALCRNSGFGRDSTGHCWVKESFGKPDEALAIQVVTGG
jgi:hypothetical protein